MPGRGPKIFQVEQKERSVFVALAFSKAIKLDCSACGQF